MLPGGVPVANVHVVKLGVVVVVGMDGQQTTPVLSAVQVVRHATRATGASGPASAGTPHAPRLCWLYPCAVPGSRGGQTVSSHDRSAEDGASPPLGLRASPAKPTETCA